MGEHIDVALGLTVPSSRSYEHTGFNNVRWKMIKKVHDLPQGVETDRSNDKRSEKGHKGEILTLKKEGGEIDSGQLQQEGRKRAGQNLETLKPKKNECKIGNTKQKKMGCGKGSGLGGPWSASTTAERPAFHKKAISGRKNLSVNNACAS